MGKRIKSTRGMTVSELIAKRDADITATALNPMSWGRVNLTKNDLIIPRLQLVQAMSEVVTQKKASPGEIRDSLNNSLLAKEGTPLEVLPFYSMKKFKVNKISEVKGKTRKEFHKMVLIQDNPAAPGYNEELAWNDEEMIGGVMTKIERVRTYDLFFVIPKLGRDIAYVMSFASSNIKAAKNILLQMALNQEAGKTPAAYCFNLDIVTKSNDDSTWYVIDATLGRGAEEDEQGKAFKWYERLQAGEAKAHSDDESV